jgi:hypothetical protein
VPNDDLQNYKKYFDMSIQRSENSISDLSKYLNFDFKIVTMSPSDIELKVEFEHPEYISLEDSDQLSLRCNSSWLIGLNWRSLGEQLEI